MSIRVTKSFLLNTYLMFDVLSEKSFPSSVSICSVIINQMIIKAAVCHFCLLDEVLHSLCFLSCTRGTHYSNFFKIFSSLCPLILSLCFYHLVLFLFCFFCLLDNKPNPVRCFVNDREDSQPAGTKNRNEPIPYPFQHPSLHSSQN